MVDIACALRQETQTTKRGRAQATAGSCCRYVAAALVSLSGVRSWSKETSLAANLTAVTGSPGPEQEIVRRQLSEVQRPGP